jgi:hypothetical protein
MSSAAGPLSDEGSVGFIDVEDTGCSRN